MLSSTIRKLKSKYIKFKKLLNFYITSLIDFLINKTSTKIDIWTKKQEIKRILFISEDVRIDILRYFEALNSSNKFEVVMLITHSNLDHLFIDAGFESVSFFRNDWDFRNQLNSLGQFDLVHGFTRRCRALEILIKEYEIPNVISVKDTSVSSFGINPPRWYLRREIPSEKFVFENTDGILAESLEVCHAFRLFKIEIKPIRIYFPNYCLASNIVSSISRISDNEIHLVYVGSVSGSQTSKADHGNIQLHWLIDTLNEQKVHFHIYPNPNMVRVDYEEYFNMSIALPYFHMHESVKPELMNKEISKYHFGVIPFFHEDTKRANEKRYYSSSLKIFNYAESSLPMLISKDMGHQRWLMERYGLAIGVDKKDFHNLKSILNSYDNIDLINNLKIQREKLTLGNQIHRATDLYKKIIKNKLNQLDE